MGTRWPFWVFIAVLAVLHFALHLGFGLGVVAPDLLTVAVLLAARVLPGASAAGLGLVLGLVQDALALRSFGAEAVTQAVIGFAGAHSRDLFVGESAAFVGIYLFVGKWVHDVLFYVLARPGGGSGVVARLLLQAPLAALYAALCGLVALFLYRAAAGER